MIPIFVNWSSSTARVQGHIVKLVACEECCNEYVYLLRREGIGSVSTVYGVNLSESENPETGAYDSLDQYLKNDFDAVPCPVCGHYQRSMFPKLFTTQSLGFLASVVGSILAILFSALLAIHYLNECCDSTSFGSLVWFAGSLGLLAIAVVFGLRLRARERRRWEDFDPNTLSTKRDRIMAGRMKAKTRAEFEASNCDPRILDIEPRESNG